MTRLRWRVILYRQLVPRAKSYLDLQEKQREKYHGYPSRYCNSVYLILVFYVVHIAFNYPEFTNKVSSFPLITNEN
jgi:hypothetical protein